MTSLKCEYDNHPNNNEQLYYCFSCQKIICQSCLQVHNIKKEFNNHKYEILNDLLIKIISKKKKIELDLSSTYNNNIINSNNKEGIDLINNKLNKYAKILNSINNVFRKEFNDYKIKFNEFETQKNKLIENISNINGNLSTLQKLTQAHDVTNSIYADLFTRINNINTLYNYTNNVFNNINNNLNGANRSNTTINVVQNKKIIFEKINNNNILLPGLGDIFQNIPKKGINKKVEETKIQNEENKIGKERKSNSMHIKYEFDKNKNIYTKEAVDPNKNKKDNNIINNNKNYSKNNNNNKLIELIENENKKIITVTKKEKENDKLNILGMGGGNSNNNLINKKKNREESNSKEKEKTPFVNDIYNYQNNKKIKLDNQNTFLMNFTPPNKELEEQKNAVNDNNKNFYINSINRNTSFNNIIINNNNNIIISKEINKTENIKYIFGLSVILKEEREIGEIGDNNRECDDFDLERIVVLTDFKVET